MYFKYISSTTASITVNFDWKMYENVCNVCMARIVWLHVIYFIVVSAESRVVLGYLKNQRKTLKREVQLPPRQVFQKKATWTFVVIPMYTFYLVRLHYNSILHFQVYPIVIFKVWIIQIPVPPLPKRTCHFVQKFRLCFVTEYDLPQASSSGSTLLPQFLLVSSLY